MKYILSIIILNIYIEISSTYIIRPLHIDNRILKYPSPTLINSPLPQIQCDNDNDAVNSSIASYKSSYKSSTNVTFRSAPLPPPDVSYATLTSNLNYLMEETWGEEFNPYTNQECAR